MGKHDLGTESITRLFWAYAIPAIIGVVVFSLYSIADGIFVSRFVGMEGLSAVSLSSPILMLFSCMSILIGSGGNTAVSVALGKQDKDEANRLFSMAVIVLIGITVVVSLVLVFLASAIARAMGAEGQTHILTTQYIRLCGVFCVSFMLSSFLFMSLDAVGKPSAAMLGSLISSLGNILLDWVFVVILHKGVIGAAAASGLAATLATIYCVLQFQTKSSMLRFHFVRLEWGKIRDMLFNGGSEGLEAAASGIVLALYNHVIITRTGTVGLAAFSIIQYCFSFIGSVMTGAAEGLNPIIAFNYGAKSKERVVGTLKVFIVANAFIAIASIIVLLLSRENMIAVFGVSEPNVAEMAKKISIIYSAVFLFKGLNDIGIMYFTSITNAKMSALLAIIRIPVLRGILIIAMPIIFGDDAIWFVTPLSEVLTLVLCTHFVRRSLNSLFV